MIRDMAVVIVKVSSNGQVSIPAAIRRRWGAAKVAVIDNGNEVIIRPVPNDPISAFRGSWKGTGFSSEEMRREMRREERAAERRRERGGR